MVMIRVIVIITVGVYVLGLMSGFMVMVRFMVIIRVRGMIKVSVGLWLDLNFSVRVTILFWSYGLWLGL